MARLAKTPASASHEREALKQAILCPFFGARCAAYRLFSGTKNHVHNFIVNSYLFPCIYTPPVPLPRLDKKSCAQTQLGVYCGDPLQT